MKGDWRGGDGLARVGYGSARAASAGDGLGPAGRSGRARFGLSFALNALAFSGFSFNDSNELERDSDRFAYCAVHGGGVCLSYRREVEPATERGRL